MKCFLLITIFLPTRYFGKSSRFTRSYALFLEIPRIFATSAGPNVTGSHLYFCTYVPCFLSKCCPHMPDHFLRSFGPRIGRLPLCGNSSVGELSRAFMAHCPQILYNFRREQFRFQGALKLRLHIINIPEPLNFPTRNKYFSCVGNMPIRHFIPSPTLLFKPSRASEAIISINVIAKHDPTEYSA